MSYQRYGDLPSGLEETGLVTDAYANFFKKDPQIPDSFVIAETSFIGKENYTPIATGTVSSTHQAEGSEYYAYEESVNDIGGGIFRVTTRYAKVPSTWYSFETLNIPYVKFRGVSVVAAGGITINSAFLYNYLNVQSISDVKFFDEDGFTDSEEKTGTINVACRVKHDYLKIDSTEVSSGAISTIDFPVSSSATSFGDGPLNCGYIQRSGDPQENVGIDTESTFTFTNTNPSPKIKIESGVYAGHIYYRHTHEIVRDVKV
tara:strand:+ start:4376 stop:5155 length:780 start_codon:yes stop_codon:yes gene_type:complete